MVLKEKTGVLTSQNIAQRAAHVQTRVGSVLNVDSVICEAVESYSPACFLPRVN